MMNSRPTKKPDTLRGPFKGMRTSMARLFASKRFTFAISLLAAVFAWSALVASDGTLSREKTFSNVAVGVTGETTLKTRGYIVMDDIEALIPGVRMVVEVAQQNYNRVSGTSYGPYIDVTDVQGVGENVLPVSFSSQMYGPVVSCEPSSVVVNVERYITRRVPVVLELAGEAPQGMYLDAYKTDPTMLSVSGPQSLVSSVARAAAKLDLSALSLDRASDRTAIRVTLQNAKGEPVISDKISITNQTVITDSIVVETELVPSRDVPLNLSAFVQGEPAPGYELVAVTTEQETLTVAARKETLDGIEFLTTDQPLDIEGAAQDVSGYVRLKRLTGVENTLPSEIAVTAQIQEKTIERTLRNVDVEVDGLPAGMKAALSGRQATVQLTGRYTFIDALQREDVRLFVDVSGLEAGEHVLPVQIRIDNAPEFTCALSTPEVTVTITDKP
ncbi:MAG: hypothetical protein IKK34_01535 [Clostridia bacterium]|nr:hypothetical protein [Clostridia bacterium]